MRVLILSANTGGGHNSAADAVRTEFERQGVTCEVRDALSFVSEIHSDIISSGHTYIYRYFPQLFGIGYRFEERHPPRFIYEQMALGAKRFTAFLNENAFEAVVSTHIFGSMLVTEVRKRFGITIPHYVVITDYALYPGTDMVDVERYFIGADGLIPAYVQAGVSPDRLMVSGIPIRSGFLETHHKTETRKSLHLPEQARIVLLFSGSIGCVRLHRIAPELEKNLPSDAHLVIICGHNKRAYESLLNHCGPQTTVVGYSNRIAEYMAAADLCISKPGGLSITEMLVMQLPMVLMLSVPGCESRNLTFFEENGIAVATEDWDEAILATVRLLRSPDALSDMRHRMKQIGYPGGAKVIVDTVINRCKN